MHAVWLCSLERELRLAKGSEQSERPHTSCMERQSKHPSKQVKPSASTRQLQPINRDQHSKGDEELARKKKAEEGHACWLAWCEQKNEKAREEKQRTVPNEQQRKQPTAASTEASFLEWKRSKWKQKKEAEEAAMLQREYQLDIIAKYDAKRRAALAARQSALTLLKSPTKKKKKRYVIVPPPKALHTLIPVEYMSPQVQEDIERKLHRQLNALEDDAPSDNFRDALAERETKRFQKKMHSAHAQRADSLEQLRQWAKPTREIYILASLLFKLIALEATTNIELIDVWRWLPWSLVRTVFQDDLVQTLQTIQVTNLTPQCLALVYLHCAQPNFSIRAIEARSAVATALRQWVHNLAAVYEIVDPVTQCVRGIDSLKVTGVSCRDIGALVLLLQVYPHVNIKLKYRGRYTELQLKERQTDLKLLRELYALPPPATKDLSAISCVEESTDATNNLIGLLDLPSFSDVPKMRSKLAARLAERLKVTQEYDETVTSPCGSTPVRKLQDDFVVVFKMTVPSKQEEDKLTPVNYISHKRRDSTLKQPNSNALSKSRRATKVDLKMIPSSISRQTSSTRIQVESTRITQPLPHAVSNTIEEKPIEETKLHVVNVDITPEHQIATPSPVAEVPCVVEETPHVSHGSTEAHDVDEETTNYFHDEKENERKELAEESDVDEEKTFEEDETPQYEEDDFV